MGRVLKAAIFFGVETGEKGNLYFPWLQGLHIGPEGATHITPVELFHLRGAVTDPRFAVIDKVQQQVSRLPSQQQRIEGFAEGNPFSRQLGKVAVQHQIERVFFEQAEARAVLSIGFEHALG